MRIYDRQEVRHLAEVLAETMRVSPITYNDTHTYPEVCAELERILLEHNPAPIEALEAPPIAV